MTSALRALRRFWFSIESPRTLALTRIVLCAYATVAMLPHDLGRLRSAGRRPMEFLDSSPVLDLLPIPFPLPEPMLAGFGYLMIGLGLLAAIGLFTRPALLLFAAGYWYIGAAISAWGYVTHSRALPAHVLLILAVAPGATAWSVDRLVAWAWRRRRGAVPPMREVLAGPAVPRWGTQLILVLIATVMLSAGLSKLRHGGLRWADGQTLGFYLTGGTTWTVAPVDAGADTAVRSVWRAGYSQLSGPSDAAPAAAWKDGFGIESYLLRATPTRLARAIARHRWLVVVLSVSAMLFELSAPVLLLGPWPRTFYLLGAVGFFLGIKFTMRISFAAWIVVCPCAVDWVWLAEQLRSGLPRWPLCRPVARAAQP